MSGHDAFELLASIGQARSDQPIAAGDDATADAMLREIVSTPPSVWARTRRWLRRTIVAIAALTTIGGLGVLADAIWSDEPTDPVTLSCYSDASLQPDIQVGLIIDPESTPEQQCATQWEGPPLGPRTPPPTLAACVSTQGAIAVIPTDGGGCASIGLAPLDPAFNDEPNMAAQVTAEISANYPERCVESIDEAVRILQTILDDLDAEGWIVRPAGQVGPREPCAVARVDAAAQVVEVVTIGAAPGD